MEIFQLSASQPNEGTQIEPNVTAVGFFDGIHLGHQQVILEAKEQAEQRGLKSAVMTFDPHPSVVLKKNKQHARYITPLEEKQHILEEMGIDYLYIVHFDKELASLSPQQFVDNFFGELQVKHVVAGFDFSYGHKGQGSMTTLSEHAKGRFTHTVVEKVEDQDNKISSTRIRNLLEEGDVRETRKLLGRPFKVSGLAGKDAHGQWPDSPSASLELSDDYFLPKSGVYTVSVKYNERFLHGWAVLDRQAALQEQHTSSLAVFLLDFNEKIYDGALDIYFYEFIREEKKFDSSSDRKFQLEKDESAVRQFFKKN